MKSLNEWRKEVHGLARSKGWWGEVPDLSSTSVLAKLTLVVSELSGEAVEIVREANFDPVAVWATYTDGARVPYAEMAATSPSLPKPEGFGTEIADAVIRVLDLMGALDMELIAREDLLDHLKLKFERPEVMTADEILASIMRVTSMLGKAADVADEHPPLTWDAEEVDLFRGWVTSAVVTMCALGFRLGVNMGARIAEKHLYNVTRSHRHGGRRA